MKINYSELIITRNCEINVLEIIKKLKQGTKIILLTDKYVDIYIDNLLDRKYEKMINKSMLFQQYTDKKFSYPSLPVNIVNGKGIKRYLGEISDYFLNFNREQYLIEHEEIQKSIIITAGAGTGKTTVMIQRILFLIKVENVVPEEITMITFTREAAKNMYEKLNEALFLRYKITEKPEYLDDIEQIRLMTISTIDSFLKQIIQKLSGEVGLSPNFNIKSFGREKKEIIELVLDNYINETMNSSRGHKELRKLLSNFKDYELTKHINYFWDEFDKKGIPLNNLNKLKEMFSSSIEDPIHLLICEVIHKSNELFNEQQINENSITLSTMSKLISKIIKSDDKLNELDFKLNYLFIDEFQDSSDFQIELAQIFLDTFKIKTFIVGDIKQAIYRFRGADDNAFEKMKKGFKESLFSSFSLKINYRSTNELIKKMDEEIFMKWGQHFTYNDEHRLISYQENSSGLKPLRIINVNTEIEDSIKLNILEIIQKSDWRNQEIAVLTRTRKEGQRVATWFEENHIPFYLDIGGTLFESESARDLNRLLHSLLFSNSSQHVCDYLQSPYSKNILDPNYLIHFNGNEREIIKSLEPYLTELKTYQEKIRIIPILSLIRNIIKESEVFSRYYEMKIREGNVIDEAKRLTILYRNNLNKIMDIILEQVSSDYISLPSLLNWLKIQIKTNRDEDEVKNNEVLENVITIQTVHRSKGLEYDSVLIPFTDRFFFTSLKKTSILFSQDKNRACIKLSKNWDRNIISYSSDYNNLKRIEEAAVTAEELRLLYVAMTRAREHLWILKSTNKLTDTWSKYIPSKIQE